MTSDILIRLEAFPNVEFLSENFTEASRWILDFGLLDKFPPDADQGPWIGVFDGCKTHWIVVRIVRGDAEPGSDGIYVSCIPRSAISGENLKAKIYGQFSGKVLRERAPRSFA